MTREEAIKELNTFKISAKSELGENALDMAIQSLGQIEQIKHILKEWYLDSCLKGDDYMNEIREVLDK